MPDDVLHSPEFIKLFKQLWSDEQTARIHRARARRLDLNVLVYEALCVASGLEGPRPLIDETSREGMQRYLDETRLIIGAMPAPDAYSLGRKLAALGTLDPLTSSNGNLSLMLKAALRADLRRVEFPNPPPWFVEEEHEQKTRADAGKRRSRRKARDHPRNDVSDEMSAAKALDILGLHAGASVQEIRAAYKRIIRAVHPDAGGSNYLAMSVNAARDTLLDGAYPNWWRRLVAATPRRCEPPSGQSRSVGRDPSLSGSARQRDVDPDRRRYCRGRCVSGADFDDRFPSHFRVSRPPANSSPVHSGATGDHRRVARRHGAGAVRSRVR